MIGIIVCGGEREGERKSWIMGGCYVGKRAYVLETKL